MAETGAKPDERKNFVIADKYRRMFAEHLNLYRSDPEKAHMWDARLVGGEGVVPTLLLTTTGRRSGEPRQATMQYFRDGDRYLLVASQGGMPQNPFWFLNLVDNPIAKIQVASKVLTVRARTAEGEERERLWEFVSNQQTNYKKYQARSPRIIPVIILEVIDA
jgi:deazaflavin-dependent oxidoreductase (nitroreductase family)